MNKAIFGFDEEKEPAGTTDIVFLTAWRYTSLRKLPEGTLANQVKTHPWFIIVWEPLRFTTPSPPYVKPYCCYIRTIVFYRQPYKVDKKGTAFVDYGTIEHTLTHDDLLIVNCNEFKIGAGQVCRFGNEWWMKYCARKNN